MIVTVRKLSLRCASTRLQSRIEEPWITSWGSHLCVNPKKFSDLSFDQIGSNTTVIDADQRMVRIPDYPEFDKWHNGGGFFHKSAHIDPTTRIEIGAIVHSESTLGPNVHIGSGAVVGPAVTIGQSTKIGYNAALSNCSIGYSCIIHNGACIGQDGFGFFVDEQGNMSKKPQMLYARIGNHVEIGANTCIDRGSWRDTTIGDFSKIDNLVQIGHNVVIGKCCILCGQVGIAGSVMMGDYVTLGGKVSIRDHVSVASKVRLAANSCVTKDIKEPGDYGGFPARHEYKSIYGRYTLPHQVVRCEVPIHEWRRQVATQRREFKKGTS